MTVLDLADWVRNFEDSYPFADQLPFAPRVELQTGSPQIMFGPVEVDLPRIQLRSASTSERLQLQTDRFVMTWSRSEALGEPANYPGYLVMKANWRKRVAEFREWHNRRLGPAPAGRLIELAYVNSVPLDVAGQKRRLSDIFKFIQPGRALNGFQVSWIESLVPEPNAARVTAQAGLGSAPTGASIFGYNFIGLGPIAGTGADDDSLDVVDKLHDRIIEMRSAAIHPQDEVFA